MSQSVTKSEKLSLSDDDIRLILLSFLRGQCALEELQEKLKGCINICFDPLAGQREIRDIKISDGIQIQVTSDHLCHMLQKFIDKKCSAEELSNWAAFVYMLTPYVPEGETEEAQWQSGEGVAWEIIQKLAEPDTLASFDVQIAQGYLKVL